MSCTRNWTHIGNAQINRNYRVLSSMRALKTRPVIPRLSMHLALNISFSYTKNHKTHISQNPINL